MAPGTPLAAYEMAGRQAIEYFRTNQPETPQMKWSDQSVEEIAANSWNVPCHTAGCDYITAFRDHLTLQLTNEMRRLQTGVPRPLSNLGGLKSPEKECY